MNKHIMKHFHSGIFFLLLYYYKGVLPLLRTRTEPHRWIICCFSAFGTEPTRERRAAEPACMNVFGINSGATVLRKSVLRHRRAAKVSILYFFNIRLPSIWLFYQKRGPILNRRFVFVWKGTTTFWKCRKRICPKKSRKGQAPSAFIPPLVLTEIKGERLRRGRHEAEDKKEWKMSEVIICQESEEAGAATWSDGQDRVPAFRPLSPSEETGNYPGKHPYLSVCVIACEGF